MKLKFWGVRGSIPSSNRFVDAKWKLQQILASAMNVPLSDPQRVDEFIAGLPYHLLYPVGVNTSCVEINVGSSRVILDAGSGLRKLGLELSPIEPFSIDDLCRIIEKDLRPPAIIQPPPSKNQEITILFSHTHWDHIQGFPFFAPAYDKSNRILLYGANSDNLAAALGFQQSAPDMFPIDLYKMGAELVFNNFPEGGLMVGDLQITAMPLPHPGGSLAFRINGQGRSVAYATDYEFADSSGAAVERFVKFISGVDILISDTQYTYLESMSREGWGHSTSFVALELALRAQVGQLFLFHHDPDHSDFKLFDNLEKTKAYQAMINDQAPIPISLASEGLSIEI